MRQIMHGLQWDLIDPGLIIEHKAYSICVHYRLARDREKAAREVEAALPQLDPAPLVIDEKCGINRPTRRPSGWRWSVCSCSKKSGRHSLLATTRPMKSCFAMHRRTGSRSVWNATGTARRAFSCIIRVK